MVFSASSATAYARARRHRVLSQAPARLARRRAGRRVRVLPHRLPAPAKRSRRIILLAAIVGLALVFVPHVGLGVNGGRRWIGTSSISVEPSEFAKLALVIYLSAVLSARGERITSLVRGLVPLCVPVAIMAVLVLKEPDMGTASLLLFTAFALVLRRRRARRSSGRGRARDGSVRGAHRARESVSARAHLRLRRSLEGSAEHGLSHRAVAARARQRRPLRRRAWAPRARSSSICPSSTPTSSSRCSARSSA